jgi:thiosulfate dehydrogenase [quinone] large subunit
MVAVKRLVFGLLRVWLGFQWIEAGLHKMGYPAWFGAQAGTGVKGFMMGAVAKAAGDHPAVQGWYASFLQNFAIPHATLFSYMVTFGEVMVGIALITGALTGFAALMGAFMNLNFMLAGSTSTNPILFSVSMILLFAGVASAYYGVDRLVANYMKPVWERVRGMVGQSA